MSKHSPRRVTPALAAVAAIIFLSAVTHAQIVRAPSTAEANRILTNQHTEEVRSLKNLPPIAVVGEIIAIDPADKTVLDALKGLSVQDIEKAATDELKSRKIPIFEKQQWDRNRAFLKLKVEFAAGTTGKAPYIGLVKVSLAQPVALQRQLTGKQVAGNNWDLGVFDVTNFLFAETWHTQQPFDAKDVGSIFQVIRDQIVQFELDYSAKQ